MVVAAAEYQLALGGTVRVARFFFFELGVHQVERIAADGKQHVDRHQHDICVRGDSR